MTNAPLSWTVERAGNLLEQEVVWSCGLCGGSDLQVARATEGRGLMGGPGRFWEPPGLRLAELGWDARRAWWAWCVRPPRGHFTCSAAPHLEGICPQGTLGDGWGHLWLSHLGGGPWHRGAGRLLHTPQSPGGSPTEDDLAPNAISVKAEKPLKESCDDAV